ncbi:MULTISPECIES: hypothetical protein [unclassified Microcoleus]|uniref:hypothetical protein n=1 Tax=unclassified Microcoleus TaxID=2642155 RepID=UPI002FD70CB2
MYPSLILVVSGVLELITARRAEIAKPSIRGIENRSPALKQKPSTSKATAPQNMVINS